MLYIEGQSHHSLSHEGVFVFSLGRCRTWNGKQHEVPDAVIVQNLEQFEVAIQYRIDWRGRPVPEVLAHIVDPDPDRRQGALRGPGRIRRLAREVAVERVDLVVVAGARVRVHELLVRRGAGHGKVVGQHQRGVQFAGDLTDPVETAARRLPRHAGVAQRIAG